MLKSNSDLENLHFTPLSSLAEIVMGQSPDSKFVNDEQFGSPFLQGNGEFATKYPKPIHWVTHPGKMAKKGDILISVRAPVGEINISDQDYCIGRGLAAIRFKNRIDPDYGWYAISFYKGQINRFAQGSTFLAVNSNDIRSIEIPMLEESEQRKIAEILTTVDDAIEQTEALIHKYQRIKQGLMQDLLTRGVDENGELRPYPNMRPDLYKRSELGWIPAGCKIQKISEFAIVKGGKRLPVGAQFEEDITPFPYIRVTDFYDFTVDPSSIKYISTDLHEVIKRYVISVSDVYISIAGTIGLTGTIPEKLDGANLTENAARITQINGVNNRFLAYFLGSNLAQTQISTLIGTTTQPKLALERIEQIRVLIPHYEEQLRIIEVLNGVIASIDKLQKEQKKLVSLKQGLMQDLLTGKVRVNALLD